MTANLWAGEGSFPGVFEILNFGVDDYSIWNKVVAVMHNHLPYKTTLNIADVGNRIRWTALSWRAHLLFVAQSICTPNPVLLSPEDTG